LLKQFLVNVKAINCLPEMEGETKDDSRQQEQSSAETAVAEFCVDLGFREI